MPEHLIRLRGGWLCLEDGGAPDASASASGPRITLPVCWPAQAVAKGAVRLVRWFTAPVLNASRESLSLRMSAVGGLVSVQLNGQELARPAQGTEALELPLPDPLPRRNYLVLDVRLGGAVASHDFPQPAWGFIALVIRDQGPVEDAGSPGSRSGDESLGERGPPA
jgi:hypothetical protein